MSIAHRAGSDRMGAAAMPSPGVRGHTVPTDRKTPENASFPEPPCPSSHQGPVPGSPERMELSPFLPSPPDALPPRGTSAATQSP